MCTKVTCVIAIVFFSLASCTNKVKNTAADDPETYNVLTLEPRSVTTYNDVPATVQGKNVVDIRPMVDGYLETINVAEGAIVKQGQLLFRLKNPQYEQNVLSEQAAIKIAVANVNTAQMNADKVKPLVQEDIVSKYELESAEYSLQSSKASLAQAYTNLANAKTNLGYTELRSPLNGVLGGINYKIGALVSSTSTQPLTTLSNSDTVYAYFSISEKQLSVISDKLPGNTLQDKLKLVPPVSLININDSIYPITGVLQTASGLISSGTGSASLKAQFANPKHRIRSGSSVNVRIPLIVDSALLVPQSATFEIQDKKYVYKLTTGDKVLSTQIVSRPTTNGLFVIVQSGLKKGDRILIGATSISDSTKIVPKAVSPASVYGTTTIH